MKHYPSIPNSNKVPRQPCYGFVKYDGSNLRFGWTRKKGWHKFGSRNLMINESHPGFGPAIPHFREKYADNLEKIFRTNKLFQGVQEVVVFCEWFGAKSFAGQHVMKDPKALVLFDVNPVKKGMLGPKEFLDAFGHLQTAELCYQGNLNDEVIQAVRNENYGYIDFRSQLPIQTEIPEGIIVKGSKGHDLWMAKIKTQRYYDELKRRHPTDWEKLFEEEGYENLNHDIG